MSWCFAKAKVTRPYNLYTRIRALGKGCFHGVHHTQRGADPDCLQRLEAKGKAPNRVVLRLYKSIQPT